MIVCSKIRATKQTVQIYKTVKQKKSFATSPLSPLSKLYKFTKLSVKKKSFTTLQLSKVHISYCILMHHNRLRHGKQLRIMVVWCMATVQRTFSTEKRQIRDSTFNALFIFYIKKLLQQKGTGHYRFEMDIIACIKQVSLFLSSNW